MSTSPTAYVFPPYRLVPSARTLLCGDSPVKLGGRAYELLIALLERRERTVTKDELMDLVWPRLVVEENNVQVQVATLRKLLGHPAIATVPGRGYRFTLPVHVEGTPDAALPASDAASPGSAHADGGSGNLPQWLPKLYGRERDLETLTRLLAEHRLVSLVGPAGIGKTRLAQAAARASAGTMPGGVWWVDLAPLADPSLLPGVVALVLGVSLEGGRDAVAAIAAALPDAPTLVVLDNAEHLLQATGAWIADIRARAPQVRLLVTSQESMHAADEQVMRLGPLPLPADGDDAASVRTSGAVALFVARAQAAERAFTLTDDHCAAAADICRELDGNPLAIELAAARVPLLGVEGLRLKLDQRFRVLTSGDRTALRRHRTLREALDWSYQLLSTAEQAVLRRLGVFVGGFTLEAAQGVASDEEGIDAWDVLEHLGALVDKSLVIAEGDPLPRYRLLESTRLFALDRLIEHGEAAQARTAHRHHYLALAERERARMLAEGTWAMPQVALERDNLLLALAWSQDDEDGALGLRLAAAMHVYWTSYGQVTQGLQVLRAALARGYAQSASLHRSYVESLAGHFCRLVGELVEAQAHAERGLELARALPDPQRLNSALCILGRVYLRRGTLSAARRCADEALAVGRRIGDSHELGNALALAADITSEESGVEDARALVQENLEVRQRLGQRANLMMAHLHLAHLDVETGDTAAALIHLREAYALEPYIGSVYGSLSLLSLVAEWAAGSGRVRDSVRLHAACSWQSRRAGVEDHLEPSRLRRFAKARQAVPEEERDRLEESGRGLSLRAALVEVAHLLAS